MINIIGIATAIAIIVFCSIYILLLEELNKKVIAATIFILVGSFSFAYHLNELIVNAEVIYE